MEWMGFTQIMEAAAILFGIFGLIVTYIARGVDGWPKHLCAAILASSVVASVFDLLESAALYYRVSLPLCRGMIYATTLLVPIPPLLVTAYLLYCCGESWRKSAVMYIQSALTGVLIATEIVGLLIGQIDITPDYTVRFGQWRVFYWILMIAITAVILFAILRRWKKLTRAQRIVFLISFFTPSFIQGVLVELLLLVGLVRSYTEQKDEAARQRARNAILQMRPHFIHNTLMSIYYLCAQDPEKAQRVIKDFSRYLQSNFTAVAQEGTIPFSKELEHTRAYLAVEQARYEGQLFVEFDTPNTFFRVPALTVQPIVENAIQHGLDPDLGPLYVSVVTEDAPDGVRIIVEDTGPGYAPTDGTPQFALDNIRERLKTLCSGTLEIEPREAGGTKVTVFVPLQNSEQQPGKADR